jgi:hypothetical protein
MATFKITDPTTGQTIRMTADDDTPPTEGEIRAAFSSVKGTRTVGNPDASPAETERMRREFVAKEGSIGTRVKEALPSRKTLADLARPMMEGGGAVLGGIVGGGGALLAGQAGPQILIPEEIATVPAGAIAGAGLGYAGGARLADALEGKQRTLADASMQSLKDVGTGATLEMGGRAIAPALGMAAKGAGKVIKPVLGRLSGVGPGAIDEAIQSGVKAAPSMNPVKSNTAFDKAMRGDTSGEEIVDNARAALNTLKEQRSSAYQSHLKQIGQNTQPIDMRPFKQETVDLMKKYNVQASVVTGKNGQPQLQLDTSRIAMGKTGRNDIEEIVQTIANWGTKQGDNTAEGLDVLKRQLDDFYSDSSQARQFVTTLRNKVKDTIVANVPQYDEMTKGYTEATKLIKDVEADLMMRKQGMSGRITADKTLRRLTSAMRDNFEMRRELVDILGAKGGEDLTGQIAGYTMNTPIPRGLAGTGPLLAGQAAYAQFVNPSFWPVLAASSPRIQGEFLRMFGKGMGAAKSIGPQGGKAIAIQSAVSAKDAAQQ